jgi:prevent-host-death family protein
VAEAGLRELRQAASELVRRAVAGERLTITVAGCPAVVLGPVRGNAWWRWNEVADVFRTPVDEHWERDRDLVDQSSRTGSC